MGSNRRRQACFRELGLLTCVGDAVLVGTSGSRPRTFKQSRSETTRLAQARGGGGWGGILILLPAVSTRCSCCQSAAAAAVAARACPPHLVLLRSRCLRESHRRGFCQQKSNTFAHRCAYEKSSAFMKWGQPIFLGGGTL